jgi:hypothetical protein
MQRQSDFQAARPGSSDPASGTLDPTPCSRALAALAELTARQRAAILVGDTQALDRLFEAMLRLVVDLVMVTDAGPTLPSRKEGLSPELLSQVRDVRDQIRINRRLIANGMAAADRFILIAVRTTPAADAALFSEVA